MQVARPLDSSLHPKKWNNRSSKTHKARSNRNNNSAPSTFSDNFLRMSLRFWAGQKDTNLPSHLWKFCHLKRKLKSFKNLTFVVPKRFFFSPALIKSIFKKHESKSHNIFTTCVISLADIVCVWSSPIYKVVVRNWERFQLVYSVLSASSQKFHQKVIFILRGRDRKRRIKAWAQKIFCWRGESKSLTEFIYFLI